MTTATAKIDVDLAAKEIVVTWPCSAQSLVMSPEIARRLAVILVECADTLTRPRLDDDMIGGNGGHDDRR